MKLTPRHTNLLMEMQWSVSRRIPTLPLNIAYCWCKAGEWQMQSSERSRGLEIVNPLEAISHIATAL